MYKQRTSLESAMEYAERTLPNREFERLVATRNARIEEYARVLGRVRVAESFDAFFWPTDAAVDEWARMTPKTRERRIAQFDQAMKHQARGVDQRAAAEARLLAAEAVNDDVAEARRVGDGDTDDTVISVEGFAIRSERPRHRAECPGYRPCPYVSCRYHLYLDVTRRGRLRLNFPKTAVADLDISCALDLAEKGPKTLEQIGHIMGGISRERVRQIEQAALNALRAHGGDVLVDFLEHSTDLGSADSEVVIVTDGSSGSSSGNG